MISRRTFVTLCVVPVIWWETYWKTFFEVYHANDSSWR